MRFDPKVCCWPGCEKKPDYRVGDEDALLGLCEDHEHVASDVVSLPIWIALSTLMAEEKRNRLKPLRLPKGEMAQVSQAIHLAVGCYRILKPDDVPSGCTLYVTRDGGYMVDKAHEKKCRKLDL